MAVENEILQKYRDIEEDVKDHEARIRILEVDNTAAGRVSRFFSPEK